MIRRTTYSDLTHEAAGQLARTLALLEHEAFHETQLIETTTAHRDLTHALAHLGQTLLQPLGPARTRSRPPRRARAASDRILLAELQRRSEPRDWTVPRPAETSAAGALGCAARLARAAADLWATHHSPDGSPRSPEACLMRHPAMLGAATREWRELVVVAGAIADLLVERGTARSLEEGAGPDLSAVADYPVPPRVADGPPAPVPPTGPVDLTVARPSARPAGDPLIALHDRVDHLRRVTWMLAEVGSAPIPVLANTAAIGVMLATASATAHRQASAATGADTRAEAAALAARRWAEVARQVSDLRSPHPSASPIQVERLDVERLLHQAANTSRADHPGTADSLDAALAAYADVAKHLALALRRAHQRGEVYIRGRALPPQCLPRRPDLLEAKLGDRPATAPGVVIRQLERAYAELHGSGVPMPRRRRAGSGDRSPAA